MKQPNIPQYHMIALVVQVYYCLAFLIGAGGVMVAIWGAANAAQVGLEITLASAAATVFFVVLLVFMGQILTAFRDIAINSWHMRRDNEDGD